MGWVPVLVIGCLWALLRLLYAEVQDDAFITFVHARNLASGEGWSFGEGSALLGTTVPLVAAALSVAMRAGIEPWNAMIAGDMLLCVAIQAGLARMMSRMEVGRWYPLAGAQCLLWWPVTLAPAGMETMLAIALAVGAIGESAGRSPRAARAIAWGTAAALLRPDGLAVLGAVLVALGAGRETRDAWRRWAVWLAVPACALALLHGWMWVTFGTPLPHPMIAKAVGAEARGLGTSFLGGWLTMHHQIAGTLFPTGLVALAAMVWTMTRRAFVPLTAFVVLYVGGMTLGGAPDFLWYRTVLHIVACVYAAIGIGGAVEWMRSRGDAAPWRGWNPAAVAGVLSLALAIPQAGLWLRETAALLRDGGVRTDLKSYRTAAEWIAARSAPGDVVTAREIGYIAYFSRLRVHDLAGLVTKLSLPPSAPEEQQLAASGARWIVGAFWDAERPEQQHRSWQAVAAAGYRPVAEFPWRGGTTWVFERAGRSAVGEAE